MPRQLLPDLNDHITLPRLRAFVAIAEYKTINAAARSLRQQRQTVQGHLKSLQQFVAAPLFEGTADSRDPDRPRDLTPYGRRFLGQARQMLHLWGGLSRDTTCTVAFLPQHSYFMARAFRTLRQSDGPLTIEKQILGEQHREKTSFEHDVIGPLAAGVLDLVIGLPPTGFGDRLDLEYLYTSRLEAMISRDDPYSEEEGITLEELVALVRKRRSMGDNGLLLPPEDTRTWRLLGDNFQRFLPTESLTQITDLTSYSTKALVAFAIEDSGIVVVPSDIAYPFRSAHYFAGKDSQLGFKWVPLRDQDGGHLKHEVFATTSRDYPNPTVDAVVEAIKEAVAVYHLETGRIEHHTQATSI